MESSKKLIKMATVEKDIKEESEKIKAVKKIVKNQKKDFLLSPSF